MSAWFKIRHSLSSSTQFRPDVLLRLYRSPPTSPASPSPPTSPTPPSSPASPSPPPTPANFTIAHSFDSSANSSFDITVGDVLMPEDPAEESIADPDPIDMPVEPHRLTFEVVEKGSERNQKKLLDNVGHAYTVKRTRGTVVYWTCSVRSKANRCPATVIQRDGAFTEGKHVHNHAAVSGLVNKVKLNQRIREEAALPNQFTKSSCAIAEELYQEVCSDGPTGALPCLSSAARLVNYHRHGSRPTEPKDLDFELMHDALPQSFLQRDIKMPGGGRHLVFATDRQLDALGTANTWYLDSTFRVVSKPFYQLMTIHAFLTSGGQTKQVPLLFTLMSSRQTADYIAVFETVKELLPEAITMTRMRTDFEAATWKGFSSVFTTAEVRGCTFHHNQAIYRKVQPLGLTNAYNNDDGTNKFAKKLMALQFLQAAHIEPSFRKLQTQATTGPLRDLCTYMDQTWMHHAVWKIPSWSVFGDSVRTNNDVEAWHKRLNQKAGRKNLPFYSLVPFLHREAELLPMQLRLITDGQLNRKQTGAQKLKNERYFDLWEKYTEGELTPCNLLREVAKINGPIALPDIE